MIVREGVGAVGVECSLVRTPVLMGRATTGVGEHRPNHIELRVKRENVVFTYVACVKRASNLVNVQVTRSALDRQATVGAHSATDRQVISAVERGNRISVRVLIKAIECAAAA